MADNNDANNDNSIDITNIINVNNGDAILGYLMYAMYSFQFPMKGTNPKVEIPRFISYIEHAAKTDQIDWEEVNSVFETLIDKSNQLNKQMSANEDEKLINIAKGNGTN